MANEQTVPQSPTTDVWGNPLGEAYVYDTDNLDHPELRPGVENVVAERAQQAKRHNRSTGTSAVAVPLFPVEEERWVPGESVEQSRVFEEEESSPSQFGVEPDTTKEKLLKKIAIIVLVCVPLAVIAYTLYQVVPFPGKL